MLPKFARRFKCSVCCRTFKTSQALRVHRTSAHPPPVRRPRSKSVRM
ncbi:MAG: C2H2-type zinc finger protein [Terriglobales bacterium]